MELSTIYLISLAVLASYVLGRKLLVDLVLSKIKLKDIIVSEAKGNLGSVFDNEGVEVDHCIEANLTTGKCLVFTYPHKLVWDEDYMEQEVEKVINWRPYPMTFEPREEEIVDH